MSANTITEYLTQLEARADEPSGKVAYDTVRGLVDLFEGIPMVGVIATLPILVTIFELSVEGFLEDKENLSVAETNFFFAIRASLADLVIKMDDMPTPDLQELIDARDSEKGDA